MAIEAVQELVTNFKNVQAQIAEKQEELEKQRKAHLDFWAKFQEECRGTGHSLTEKEKDALANPEKYHTGRLTMFEYHMSMLRVHGYHCTYCLKRVPGSVEYWGPKLDLCKRESFDKWIGYQEEERPPEKVGVLDKAREEVEAFFGEAEPLEQAIEALKKEEEEIRALLESAWEILDKVLGKDVQRKEELKRLRDEYESMMPKSYPYDPDDPSGHFAWQAWH